MARLIGIASFFATMSLALLPCPVASADDALAAVGLTLPVVAPASPGPVYDNCTEAHDDGRWDIPQGDDAYWEDGDRDGDGYACDSPGN